MVTERQKIINKNEELLKIEQVPAGEKKVMLFLSYDIKDSTKLKVRYPDKWPLIIKDLFTNKFEFMDFWKFNGDEILYKKQINNAQFICNLIVKAYSFLKTLQNSMQQHINCVSIKGTLWIALAESNLSEYKHNFYFNVGGYSDFAGKHMDEGFRLTKCSSTTKLAIDPKIIYFLLDICINGKEELSESFNRDLIYTLGNVYLISYCKCKGVWNDVPYPIYWYFENSIQQDGILYGEFLNDEHLWVNRSRIQPICEQNNLQSTLTNSYNNIKQIYKHIGVSDEIDILKENLSISGEILESSECKANLYFMVVCVNPVSKRVMIARRSSNRKHLKNVWDFGNVKYQNVKMKETIIKEYKDTFGIDIKLITDKNRDNNIVPFGYCTIYRNCKPHNGLLCYAIINTTYSDEKLMEHIKKSKSYKYDEIRFVDGEYDLDGFIPLSLDEIRRDSEMAISESSKPFEGDRCIMYFKNSIKGAIQECSKYGEC